MMTNLNELKASVFWTSIAFVWVMFIFNDYKWLPFVCGALVAWINFYLLIFLARRLYTIGDKPGWKWIGLTALSKVSWLALSAWIVLFVWELDVVWFIYGLACASFTYLAVMVKKSWTTLSRHKTANNP